MTKTPFPEMGTIEYKLTGLDLISETQPTEMDLAIAHTDEEEILRQPFCYEEKGPTTTVMVSAGEPVTNINVSSKGYCSTSSSKGYGHTTGGRSNLMNLPNDVNNSSSTLRMINTSSAQKNRPSLLRRTKTCSTSNNPLLHPFVIRKSPSATTAVVATGTVIDKQTNPIISSNGNVNASVSPCTAASGLPPVSAFLKKTTTMEEIIIWQPDEEECQVVEVDESDLVCYEEFKEEDQDSDMSVHQILVCNEQFDKVLQNYVVEVLQPDDLDIDVESTSPTPPFAPSRTAKTSRSRSKKLIPLNRAGDRVGDDSFISKERTQKRTKNLVELKCLEPECVKVVHSVHDLRAHLQDEHGMSFLDETIHFKSQEEFRQWRTAYEQEHKVSFIYRGGTKKISAEKAVTYLICHRSGTYKPTITHSNERKRKMKPQGSCKIGTQCTASIKLVKHLATLEVDVTICHTHYGHDLNNFQHLRVTGIIKEHVLGKFKEGFSFPEVLQYIHHNPDAIEGLRLVDRRAIRNIYDQWRKQGSDSVVLKAKGFDESDRDEDFLQQDVGVGCNQSEKEKGVSLPLTQSEGNSTKEHIGASQRTKRKPVRKSGGSGRNDNVKASLDSLDAQKQKPESHHADSIDIIVSKLQEHGDSGSGPTVLLYKKEGDLTPQVGEAARLQDLRDMCLVIQTPIQRQLLEQFSRVICLELIQGTDLDILIVVVVDEFLVGIPVAWMICNSVSNLLLENFFQILRINCLQLHCDYLFATRKSLLQKIWHKVFTRRPRVLYPQEDVFREMKAFLRKHYDEMLSRGKVYDVIEKMILTPEKAKFEDGLKALQQTAKNSDFLQSFMTEWYEFRSRWAFHTRTQIHPALEDSFLKLRKFIIFKGTKFLGRNIDEILKIGYDKCFQHDRNLFKGNIKFHSLLSDLRKKHSLSMECCLAVERIEASKYTVSEGFTVFDLNTICQCKIRCSACDMCAHRLLCDCGDTFCVHVHATKSFIDLNPQLADSGRNPSSEFNTAEFAEVVFDEDFMDPSDSDTGREGKTFHSKVTSNLKKSDVNQPQSSPSMKVVDSGSENIKNQLLEERIRVKRSSKKIDPLSTPLITPIIISSTTTASIPSSRRISTRLLEKTKAELGQLRVDRGSKRRVKLNQVSSLPRLEHKASGSRRLLASTQESQSGPANGKLRNPKAEREAMRDELLSLIDQIDLIQDPKLFNEVKKKVSDLSNVVKKPE